MRSCSGRGCVVSAVGIAWRFGSDGPGVFGLLGRSIRGVIVPFVCCRLASHLEKIVGVGRGWISVLFADGATGCLI